MKERAVNSFDGTRIRYIINRANKKQFLFFVHGAWSNHTTWDMFMRHFKNHSFIAIDLRNHGASGRGKLTIRNQARDINEILKKEKVSKIIAVGNCYGASILLEFYNLYPKKIRKLALFSLFDKSFIRLSGLMHLAANFVYHISIPTPGRKLKFVDYRKYKNVPIMLFPIVDLKGIFLMDFAKAIKTLLEYSIDLSRIKCPALVIEGEHDFLTKNNKIYNACKNNQNIIFKRVKSHHLVVVKEPKSTIMLLEKFIKGELRKN